MSTQHINSLISHYSAPINSITGLQKALLFYWAATGSKSQAASLCGLPGSQDSRFKQICKIMGIPAGAKAMTDAPNLALEIIELLKPHMNIIHGRPSPDPSYTGPKTIIISVPTIRLWQYISAIHEHGDPLLKDLKFEFVEVGDLTAEMIMRDDVIGIIVRNVSRLNSELSIPHTIKLRSWPNYFFTAQNSLKSRLLSVKSREDLTPKILEGITFGHLTKSNWEYASLLTRTFGTPTNGLTHEFFLERCLIFGSDHKENLELMRSNNIILATTKKLARANNGLEILGMTREFLEEMSCSEFQTVNYYGFNEGPASTNLWANGYHTAYKIMKFAETTHAPYT